MYKMRCARASGFGVGAVKRHGERAKPGAGEGKPDGGKADPDG